MSVTAFGVRVKEEPGSSGQSSSEGVCYVCSSHGAEYPLNSRLRERGPYFPFLETHIPPLGADRPSSEGVVLACPVCYSFLTQQWEAHEQNGTPRHKRMYWLKRTDNGPYAGMEPSMQTQEESPERSSRHSPAAASAALDLSLPAPGGAASSAVVPASTSNEACFICGNCNRNGPLANVYAKPIANCPFFPTLASHPQPPGAKPMDSSGRVQACEPCHQMLLEQWDNYQRYTVPHSERRYRLPSRSFTCFTCGLEFPVSVQRVVSAVPGPDQQPGFPFLRTVAPPPGAQPLSSAGRAVVCSMCYKSLQRQLRVFEISNVPESKRHFKILHEGTTTPATVSPSPASVLRKQLLSPQTKYLGCYLCEKIGPMESLVACDTTPGAGPHFPFLRDVARPIAARPMDSQGRVLLCAECCAELQLQWDAFESAGLPLTQRRYHTALLTSPPSASQGACFVCTELTSETFPVGSREGPGPFFPFLESHAGQGSLDSTGTARVCTFCFHSLMAQWLAYESSPHPEDAARAMRRYNTHHYVCYICGITTYRRRVRTLTVRDFPFLREHPRPAGALTLRDGVVSCLTCFESLSSQWKDYERMRVPVEMRKYNWIVLPPPPEETRSGGSSPSGQEQALSDTGFPPPGGKPPPLQPAATKPSHTSLALSATRTSSFAAALRKLAKQAVDPVLEKDSGPVASIPGGNPRALTPKRSSSYGLPSPMACGSPPVMSGAPSGLLMETRKALDLGSLSSQHGHRLDHATKMDSSLSSLDYLSSKHLTGPPSGASGAGHKGASGNGEECPRGFQPYRGSAEELRHPTLGTLHPMSPFDAGAYPYHPTPFLPPHLAHPAYRLEDPLYQYNLLRPGPPMVSAPAIPPFYRYPMQHQAPPQQPPAQQQQPQQRQQQPTPPSLPPRTDESKEEQSRLLLLSSAKRASESSSPSLGSSHSGGGHEPLRSPPSLLTPLNLATSHSGPPPQPQGPHVSQQSFSEHLSHPASTEPWRPLANDVPPLHHLQVTKENFQSLPASFTSAMTPATVRQPAAASLRPSLPLAQSPPPSSTSSPVPVRQSPVRLDASTSEHRHIEQHPLVLSRLDMAEQRRKEARARGSAESDSEEDDDWEITLQKPIIWSGPPLCLDLNPKKLQFLKNFELTSHQKKRELQLEQFIRHWTRLHGREERLCATPPPLLKCVDQEAPPALSSEQLHQQQQQLSDQLSPRKNIREPDQQLKRQFLLLLGLSSTGTNEDRETIWRAIVMERSQRNGAVCKDSCLGNTSHRPAITSAGYLQRRALKRQLAASMESHQNGVCATAEGSPSRKPSSVQASQGKPYGRDFAYEFHESVLQHSQQQQEQEHLHQLKKRRHRPSYSIFHTRAPPMAAPNPVQESALTEPGEEGGVDPAEPVPALFQWPGVEAIMESYSRYNQERHMERVLLTERERQLRAEQQQLQEEAQRLRIRMAELYQSKKCLDEERQQQQVTIDNLKKCLRLVR